LLLGEKHLGQIRMHDGGRFQFSHPRVFAVRKPDVTFYHASGAR
jgi:hypothetical protein